MHNLRLSGGRVEAPENVVRSLGAMQSQDYGPAKWSVGQRMAHGNEADLDRAYLEGRILRTHVLRPTWHFVHPDDITWLLELTAPRIQIMNRSRYRQLGLDDRVLERTRMLLLRTLKGANHLTRNAVRELLAKNRIETDTSRLSYILMYAELKGTICSGGLRGKQHTYALVEERAPDAIVLDADAALLELILRYFSSHGPASEKDLRWWSSLTLQEIRRGLDLAGDKLSSDDIDGTRMYFVDSPHASRKRSPHVHLLQTYDEYIVGYSETRGVIDATGLGRKRWSSSNAFRGVVILDTQMVGEWKRRFDKGTLRFEISLYEKWDDRRMKALRRAAEVVADFFDAERSELEIH